MTNGIRKGLLALLLVEAKDCKGGEVGQEK